MRMGSRLTIRKADGVCRVPKNSVSRSKRLLKPQPLPHQHWVLELRTSLTKAGDGAKFADTPCVIYIEVTGVRSGWKECAEIAVILVKLACYWFLAMQKPQHRRLGAWFGVSVGWVPFVEVMRFSSVWQCPSPLTIS